MANASAETARIRREITETVTPAIERVMALQTRYQALGGAAFFDPFLEVDGQPTTDITAADFHAAMAVLADFQTWLGPRLPTLVKLRE